MLSVLTYQPPHFYDIATFGNISYSVAFTLEFHIFLPFRKTKKAVNSCVITQTDRLLFFLLTYRPYRFPVSARPVRLHSQAAL